ncbi:MAG: type II secretion system F family protein [Aquisalimonadaceae bacterium]
MAQFHYQARDNRGDRVEGHIEGGSAEAVADQLLARGVTPVHIRRTRTGGSRRSGPKLFQQKVTLTDLIIFSRQMISLTKAGVPIIQAILGLASTTRNRRQADVLRAVADELESGRSLGDAMSSYPDVFSALYVSIIRVGEESGRLEEAFAQLARNLETEKDTRDRIRSAMRYPVIVLVAISIAVAVLNIFVIPAFARLFESFGADLPWATQVLLTTSSFFVTWRYWLLGTIIVAVIGFRLATGEGGIAEPLWDRLRIRIPIIGDIVLRATLARFARSFSMALRSGVPVITALTVVARATDNVFIAGRVQGMRSAIERGESLYRSAVAAGLFTPLVLQMLAVGEETGQVDQMMEEVADFYEREVDYDLRQLSTYIEPVLILAVGAMVLVLALGVFLPMWDLGTAALS